MLSPLLHSRARLPAHVLHLEGDAACLRSLSQIRVRYFPRLFSEILEHFFDALVHIFRRVRSRSHLCYDVLHVLRQDDLPGRLLQVPQDILFRRTAWKNTQACGARTEPGRNEILPRREMSQSASSKSQRLPGKLWDACRTCWWHASVSAMALSLLLLASLSGSSSSVGSTVRRSCFSCMRD